MSLAAPQAATELTIAAETPAHTPVIEAILDKAFGPLRAQKTAYKLREGLKPLPELSIVAETTGPEPALLGALRFWPLLMGEAERPGLLLGPLAVAPQRRGQGIGAALMQEGLARARARGHARVLLIGDPAYYRRFGFHPDPVAALRLPAYEPPERVQGLALVPDAFAGLAGPVRPDPAGR